VRAARRASTVKDRWSESSKRETDPAQMVPSDRMLQFLDEVTEPRCRT